MANAFNKKIALIIVRKQKILVMFWAILSFFIDVTIIQSTILISQHCKTCFALG